ncbi:DUF1810 domain-containing protein [Rhizobium sp. LjRoot254]|uniref:DUF1810 domain-containing protein n=1 Tax=Rhizobium sp. LjRoot254 TaxID=3342297 RepID=UPI003ECEE52F
MTDEYNLQRFIDAQAPVYDNALSILRRGMMCSPYMDFIFPRLTTGFEETSATLFAVGSVDEASAYLASPVLGGRYRECIGALQHLPGLSADAVFGDIDAQKLHASLTLFSEASDEYLLETVLEVWFDSLLEPQTMKGLGRTY